jgi:hypothetical protein
MRYWRCGLALAALWALSTTALEVKLVRVFNTAVPGSSYANVASCTPTQDQTDDNRQRCSGMYSRVSWGGPVDPYISVLFTDVGKSDATDPIVSLVVFEWKDENYIGVYETPQSTQKAGICEQRFVDKGLCNATDIGEFILAPNATEKSSNVIFTKAVHLKDASPITYPIKNTGYYCVLTDRFLVTQYEAIVEFRNSYGELPATQIPKLPFYGGITLCYALVLV